jgi:hypothetical protein
VGVNDVELGLLQANDVGMRDGDGVPHRITLVLAAQATDIPGHDRVDEAILIHGGTSTTPEGLHRHEAKEVKGPVGETQRQPPSRTQPERVENNVLHADRQGSTGDSVGGVVHGAASCGPGELQKPGPCRLTFSSPTALTRLHID